MKTLMVLVLSLAACSASPPADTPAADAPAAEAIGGGATQQTPSAATTATTVAPEEQGEHEHAEPPPKLIGAMKRFHHLLKPVYHADKGSKRVDDACGQAGALQSEADKIRAEPAGDPVKWAAASKELIVSLDALQKTCAGDKKSADTELEKTHSALHTLMGLQKGAP